jgi:O-antigen ligase
LKVFLAASSVPVLIFSYELAAGPINPYIPGGRGITRYRGLYASGLNYLIYWSFALIVSAYFFLKYESKKILSPAFMIFLLLMAIITTGLFFLHQAAAYAIFAVLLLLILIFSYYKDKKKTAVVLGVLILTFIIIGLMGVFERISVLYKLDYEIIQGQYPVEMGFNGRIGKWKNYINLFNQLPIHAKLFGASLSGIQFHATATATHNDFLRILFTTGIAGLMIHLFTLGYIFFRAFRLKRNERFLVIASLAFWVMLSVSQTPSFYIPVVYYFLVVVSFMRSELFLRKRESLATKAPSH